MRSIFAITTLLFGIGLMLAGNGLIGTLLGVRGQMEGFSSATLGLIMAGYFTGFVAGTFIVPNIIRRVGHIRMFATLASICSITVLLHGLFVHPWLWFMVRAIAGVCVVGIYIVIESWLNEQTSNEQRGRIFSIYMTTTLLGLGTGQLLLLAGDIDTLHLFALGSVLMSMGLVPVALTKVTEPPVIESQRLGLAKLYAISPLGVVGAFFSGVSTGAFWGLGAVLAATLGLAAGGIAAFMALTILGGIVMMWPVGWLSDRFDRRTVLSWICLFSGLAALLALWLVQIEPIWLLAGGFAYGSTAFSIYALSAAHTNDHVGPEHMLETTSALQLMYGCGAIAGPLIAGVLMHHIHPMALLAFMAFAAFIPAGFARYRMIVSPPVPAADQGDWVPQFATSPVALEMYPEDDEWEEEAGLDHND
jgi:MFS family permease